MDAPKPAIMRHKLFIILGVVAIIVVFFTFFEFGGNETSPEQLTASPAAITTNSAPIEDCVPAFADGGGPYYKENSPFRAKIAPDVHNGEKLVVNGKIMQKDCVTPVADAVLDIWQANESGSYQDEWYRGKVRTDKDGNYTFETVIPKGYGEGTGYRPPHIHFKVFVSDRLVVTSQMFFPEVRGTPGFEDAYIMKLESKTENGVRVHNGTHNIILP